MWYATFNDVFWLSITPMVLGAGALCIRYAYRSKCSNVRVCCGLLEIQRDVDREIEIDRGDSPIIPTAGATAEGATSDASQR